MDHYTILCGWLMCLLVATFLGYERGRWFTGLWLGMFFGPLGVIAAGFIQPSIAVEAARAHGIEKQVAILRRHDEQELRRQSQKQSDLNRFLNECEAQISSARTPNPAAPAPTASQGTSRGTTPRDPDDSGAGAAPPGAPSLAGLAAALSSLEPDADNSSASAGESSSGFAARIRQLARDLERFAERDATNREDLIRWSRWLDTRADAANAARRRGNSRRD